MAPSKRARGGGRRGSAAKRSSMKKKAQATKRKVTFGKTPTTKEAGVVKRIPPRSRAKKIFSASDLEDINMKKAEKKCATLQTYDALERYWLKTKDIFEKNDAKLNGFFKQANAANDTAGLAKLWAQKSKAGKEMQYVGMWLTTCAIRIGATDVQGQLRNPVVEHPLLLG